MTRTRKSRMGGLLLFVLIILGVVGFWAWQRYTGFADAPLSGVETGETLVVEGIDATALRAAVERFVLALGDQSKP